ncbi:MAG: glycosyltransferase family 4 protein [Myxococcota bacterium]
MRIGYVVKRYPRYSETFVVNEILAHEKAGTEIEIFSLRPPNDTRFQEAIARVQAPVSYVPLGGGKASVLWSSLERAGEELPGFWAKLGQGIGEESRNLYQGIELALAARRSGLDHLHAHFATVAAGVTRVAAAFADLSHSVTAHAKDLFHESVEGADLSRKLDGATAVITVSEFNRRFLCAHHPEAAAKVERLYNGLPLDRFAFGAPAERLPRIIAVGRLIEKKGFGDLIEACAVLSRRGARFGCRIIGEGELREALEERIRKLELEPLVRLVGPQPLAVVAREIQEAAVLAAPCVVGEDGNRDGLPTVLLEAMALGTPCVSTPVTGIPEVVQHNETGLIAPERDPEALADAIERLLVDADLRVRLAGRARSLIEAEFDIERNAARQREIFARAVRSHRAERATRA